MRTHPGIPTSGAHAGAMVGRWVETWARMPATARALGLGGVLLAFGLLIGFYIVVASAVHRAELVHQHARLDLDRHVACSAFTQADARELCAVTTAARIPPDALARAVYEPPVRTIPAPHVASRLY